MAGSEKIIDIRPLSTLSELSTAVDLQQTIWGFAEADLVPLALFVVAHRIGGQVFGAFHTGDMVGFLLAVPGLRPGGMPYLHSHMLGVLPEFRDAGVGRRLKLGQRADALARGLELVEWTFDPLEIKNAWFNIERLGAIVRRYVRNQYGLSSSHLHGGLPTDRCVAEWWIARAWNKGEVVERISVPPIPPGVEQARAIQAEVATRFEQCFARGLAVIGMEERSYLLGEVK